MNFEGDVRKPKEMINSPRASKVSSSGFATHKSLLPRLSSACELGRYVAYNSTKLSPKHPMCTPLSHDRASPNKTFTHLFSSSEEPPFEIAASSHMNGLSRLRDFTDVSHQFFTFQKKQDQQ
jgi:hypothetical protein